LRANKVMLETLVELSQARSAVGQPSTINYKLSTTNINYPRNAFRGTNGRRFLTYVRNDRQLLSFRGASETRNLKTHKRQDFSPDKSGFEM